MSSGSLKSLYLSYFHFLYPPLAGSFLASLQAVGDSCPGLTHYCSAASDPQTVIVRLEFPSPKSQRPPEVTSPWGSAATWDGAHRTWGGHHGGRSENAYISAVLSHQCSGLFSILTSQARVKGVLYTQRCSWEDKDLTGGRCQSDSTGGLCPYVEDTKEGAPGPQVSGALAGGPAGRSP